MWTSFVAIGIGAVGGAWLRWGLGIGLNHLFPTLPLGTLAANLLGGFLMGVAMVVMARHSFLPLPLRLALVTGFLGSLTTMSTFSGEVVSFWMRQQYLWAGGAVVLHVGGTLVSTVAGMAASYALVRG